MSQIHTALRKQEGRVTIYDGLGGSFPDTTAGVPPQLDFVAYASIFWRRSKLLLSLTALGILVGLGLAALQTPYYRAHTSLELDAVNDTYLSSREVTSEDNASLTDSYMQTQALELQGDPIIRAALKKSPPETASAKPSLLTRGLSAIRQKLGLAAPGGTSEAAEVDRIHQQLTVRSVPMTRVLEVTFDGTDSKAGAGFTNALVDEYIQTSIERRLDATRKTEQWLMAYLTPLKQGLEESGSTLEAYAHDSGLVGKMDDDTPAQAKLRDLQAELTRAHAERVSKQAVYETFSNGPRENVSPALNPSPLREYQTKLSDLRSEYAQAVATLTPAHFRVQRLKAQISEMERLIDEEWTKTLALIRSDYLASMRREALLADSVQAQVGLVADQAGRRVHYDMLHRELETNQQIYNTLLQKAKESAVLSATRPSNAHVISEATPPPTPFKPSLPIHAALGGLTGLFLGVTWIGVSGFRDRHLIAPGVLPGVAQIRELAVIPSTSLDRAHEKAPALLSGRKAGDLLLPPPADSLLFSESFQSAVASIKRSQTTGTQLRVITVTSAMARDGKTTIVKNLGLALANVCHRVVLIEGDLRHPKLSKHFDTANSWGLSDILQSSNPIEDMPFEAFVKPTDKPGLFVLPSGPATSNLSRLLHSPRMKELLIALKRHCDLILIDSPPLLAVADARILASVSDAVILVARAHKTARETFWIAVQQLNDDQTPILGAILNAWDPRRARGTPDPFQYQYPYKN